MKSPIRITVAGPEDHDVLRTLQRVCLPFDDLIDPKTPGFTWLLARTPKRVTVAFSGHYDCGDAVVISRQGVIPAMQGLGLQKRLIAETERLAKVAGLQEVWTYTACHNLASANSFISRNFRVWMPEPWEEKGVVLEDGQHVPDTTRFTYWRKAVAK